MHAQGSGAYESARYRCSTMNLPDYFMAQLQSVGALPKEHYLVAVSGGLDSTVMLHLCSKIGIKVLAAHINYGLRGAESDADEAFVRNLCGQLGIPCDVTHMKIEKSIAKDGIQAAARAFRYERFESLRQGHGIDWIITAHHLDDRLETLLMNFTRGAGLKGLRSIPEKNGAIIRPLSKISRAEIMQFAKVQGITWREDSSNTTDVYLRNRVRHGAASEFKNIASTALLKAGESMDYLAEADDFLEHAAREFISEKFKTVAPGEWRMAIGDAQLIFAFPALGKYVLTGLGFDAGLLPSLRQLSEGQTGKKLIGKRFTVYRDREGFAFGQSQDINVAPMLITADAGFIDKPIQLSWELLNQTPDFTNTGNHIAYLDASQAKLPMDLRLWREGDRFQPLGMQGSRKVSDFLTDIKLSPVEKKNTYVLLSRNEICWVVGYRISERFKIGENARPLRRFILSRQQREDTIVKSPNEG